MIRVRIPQKKKELEVPGPRRVGEILAAAGIRPTTVIVTQGKRLLTTDQPVADGETLDVLSVASGGAPPGGGRAAREGRGGGTPGEPQLRLLPGLLLPVLPKAGLGRDPQALAPVPGGPDTGLRLRREGQPRAVGCPDGAGLSDGGALHRPGNRGVLRPVPREGAGLRRRPREGADRGGPARGGNPDSRSGETGAQGRVLGLRYGEAVLLQPDRGPAGGSARSWWPGPRGEPRFPKRRNGRARKSARSAVR